ncbi:MAG TPA: hypothetical protein ENJ90_08770, partial [Devosia sp.]|nr:hypothetical protein [Devosia sp.]
LNTDAKIYQGSNQGNKGYIIAQPTKGEGAAARAELTLPPLSTLMLRAEPTEKN